MLGILALVVALAAIPFLCFRAYARRVAAADAPVADRLHRLARAQRAGGIVLPIVAVLAGYAVGIVEFVAAAVDGVGPTLLEVAVLVGSLFAVVAVPLLAMALGTYPTTRSLRDTTASPWRIAAAVLVGIAVTAVTVVVGIAGFLAVVSVVGTSVPALVAALGGIIFLTYGLSPYLIAISRDRLPLAGEHRERVERLCRDLGYRPRGLYLLDGTSTKTANALAAGTVPRFRYVFLTDYLLEACDDDELRAILAHEFGHVAGRHLWQRGLLTVAVFGAWVAGADLVGVAVLADRFGFVGVFLPFVWLYALYHVVLLGGLAYWQELRADAYAARAVGREATVAALETLADANDTRREAGLLYALATHHPPIADRVDRLHEGDDGARSRAAPVD